VENLNHTTRIIIWIGAALFGFLFLILAALIRRWISTANRLVQEKQALLTALAELSPDSIFVKDRKGRMILANPACLNVIGLAEGDVLGKTDADFLDPEAGRIINQTDLAIMEKGKSESVLDEVPGPHGMRFFQSSKTPLKNNDGEVTGIIGISREVTEQKIAEEKADFVRKIGLLLASSLDYESTLRQMASLIVPEYADWCIVDELQQNGRLKRIAVIHADPKKRELAQRLEALPIDTGARGGAPKALREERSVLYPENNGSDFFMPGIDDSEQEKLMEMLGITSYITCLIRTQNEIFGAITLISGNEDFRYTTKDMLFSESLAERAGLAIENGRLYLQTRRSRELLDTVAEVLPALVTYIDKNERYQFVNESYLKWVAKGRGDVIGKTVRDVLGEKYYATAHPHMVKALAGERVRYDLKWLAPDGSKRIFQIDFAPVLDGTNSVLGYVMHGQDVTDLRQAIYIRDEFISVASHELKTPLSTLGLSLQLMKRKLNSDSGRGSPLNEMEKLLAGSLRQVQSMTTLINELLDVTKIQAGRFSLNLEDTDLNLNIRQIVERFSDQLKLANCPVQLDLIGEIVGHWDQTRIEQVLVNLLTNIIKYAPNGPVRISTQRDSQVATLTVQDSGPGIPIEEQKRVFNRFVRGTTGGGIAGLGLGLYIVKQIVKLHKGDIRLESSPGKGSKFVIVLPRHAFDPQSERSIDAN
jgi:PAS domain S-box-containing protein